MHHAEDQRFPRPNISVCLRVWKASLQLDGLMLVHLLIAQCSNDTCTISESAEWPRWRHSLRFIRYRLVVLVVVSWTCSLACFAQPCGSFVSLSIQKSLAGWLPACRSDAEIYSASNAMCNSLFSPVFAGYMRRMPSWAVRPTLCLSPSVWVHN